MHKGAFKLLKSFSITLKHWKFNFDMEINYESKKFLQKSNFLLTKDFKAVEKLYKLYKNTNI